MKQLGPDAERVQVLFVTVDPERDTREVLAKYVPAFDRAVPRAVRRPRGDAARGQGVQGVLREAPRQDAGRLFSIDHSAQSYVIDPQGRLRLFVRHDRIAEDLAPDLRTLLKAPASQLASGTA